jgi:hypothetical protein
MRSALADPPEPQIADGEAAHTQLSRVSAAHSDAPDRQPSDRNRTKGEKADGDGTSRERCYRECTGHRGVRLCGGPDGAL